MHRSPSIILDNGTYCLENFGDVAMLQVAIGRLRDLLPSANIHVFTYAPQRLNRFCPTAIPLSLEGRRLLCLDGSVLGRGARWLRSFERQVRTRTPRVGLSVARARYRLRQLDISPMNEFFQLLCGVDAVVASGGGYITDAFAPQSMMLMETLEIAARMGKATAMFGQGLGPIESAEMKRVARALGKLDLIGLREGKLGPELAEQAGLRRDRIIITGDDAIELAYDQRTRKLGEALGIGVRASSYSGIGGAVIRELRRVLHGAASRLRASLAPLPISFANVESDVRSLGEIMDGYPSLLKVSDLDTPAALIKRIGQCRLVITGSYHAGVFALAQGIPVIGIARSAYYHGKLGGLISQFEHGGVSLSFDEPDFEQKLTGATERFWQEAAALRPELLAAAQTQIQQGRAAFRRFAEVVEAARPTTSFGKMTAGHSSCRNL